MGAGAPRYYRNVALATVAPGAGLLRSPRRVLGAALLISWLAGVGYAGYRVVRDGGPLRAVLALAVDPGALEALAVAVGVAVVLWVASIVLTAVHAWSPSSPRHPLAGVAAAGLGCLLVAAPGALAVRYLDVQAGLVTDVFVASDAPAPAPAAPLVESPTAPAPAPTATADPWAGVPRVNLVVLGSDAGPNRVGVRTDSMVVVSIDPATGDTLLVGVPRNLENAPIPASNPLHRLFPHGYDCGDQCLLNGIWTLAENHRHLFPGVADPGRASTVEVVAAVTGLDLAHSVVVDLAGFRQLVDALGGVEVDVAERVCVSCRLTSGGAFAWTSDRREWIEPGRQRLDGFHALWYARSRATSDDFSRMRRQRCVAGALLEQADPVRLLTRYPAIAEALRSNVSVDIPREDLPAWVELLERVQAGGSIRSLPLTDDVIDPGRPDYARIRALVRTALVPPAAATPGPSATRSAAGGAGGSPVTPPSPTADPGRALGLAATC